MVPLEGSELVACGDKIIDGDPDGDATRAGRTMRDIQMFTAAPEATIRQGRVKPCIFGEVRVGEQCYRLLAGQVIAIVWRCGVETQPLDPGHESVSVSGQSYEIDWLQ